MRVEWSTIVDWLLSSSIVPRGLWFKPCLFIGMNIGWLIYWLELATDPAHCKGSHFFFMFVFECKEYNISLVVYKICKFFVIIKREWSHWIQVGFELRTIGSWANHTAIWATIGCYCFELQVLNLFFNKVCLDGWVHLSF